METFGFKFDPDNPPQLPDGHPAKAVIEEAIREHRAAREKADVYRFDLNERLFEARQSIGEMPDVDEVDTAHFCSAAIKASRRMGKIAQPIRGKLLPLYFRTVAAHLVKLADSLEAELAKTDAN